MGALRAQAALPHDTNLLVIGSGAAGLAAAVTAAHKGLRVAVVEKAAVLGGTTAWSGGWMWIPGHPLMTNRPADIEAARRYLRALVGKSPMAGEDGVDSVEAYLSHGPAMVEFFSRLGKAALPFEPDESTPDFHEALPGASLGGRMLRVAALDARPHSDALGTLRPPLRLMTLWGLAIESGNDLQHFLNLLQPLRAGNGRSWLHVARRVARFLGDLLVYRRNMHLVNGNALAARLVLAARSLDVSLHTEWTAQRLIWKGDDHKSGAAPRIAGAELLNADGTLTEIRADKGVVLACGGFPHDEQRLRAAMPHVRAGHRHRSAAPPENTGDGLAMGEAAGACWRRDAAAPAVWVPVSLWRRGHDSPTYPHLVDRAKPGALMVDRHGRRFTDEAGPYHDVAAAWLRAMPPPAEPAAWLIADRCFLFRYGFGAVKPFFAWPWRTVLDGDVQASFSVEGLARRCGIDPAGLRRTMERYNSDARRDGDTAFRRGEPAYDRSQGDPLYLPRNPCVAPVEHAPFYAIRLYPGSLGTLAGLATDADGQVLDRQDRPIPGLYACGNDMAPALGGHYPASGATLGAAMIFGHRAGLHAAGANR